MSATSHEASRTFLMIFNVWTGLFQVLLVQRLDNGQKYALKILKKSDVYKRNQIAHTNTEKNILSSLQVQPPPRKVLTLWSLLKV